MDQNKKLFEGLYLVRILSDRPQGDISGTSSLMDLLQETDSGDMVGTMVMQSEREVSEDAMVSLLKEAGSDAEFFDLPDIAALAENLVDSAAQEGCTPDLVVAGSAEMNALARALNIHTGFEEPDAELDPDYDPEADAEADHEHEEEEREPEEPEPQN